MGGASGYMAERRDTYRASVGKPERETPLEDLGVNLTEILKLIFQK
jgi:hypothetical protein